MIDPKHTPLAWRWWLAVLSVGAVGWASVVLFRGAGSDGTFWPANGLLLAVLLHTPRARWWVYLAGGCVADAATGAGMGFAVGPSVVIAAVNMFEVALAATLLRPRGETFDLRQKDNLLRFAAFAVGVAPAVTAGLIVGWNLLTNGPKSESFFGWYVPDALGIATVTPFLDRLLAGDLRKLFSGRGFWPSAGSLGLVAAVTAVTFAQSSYPLIFLCFPFLILVTFRLGFAGAAAGAMLVACVSIGLTARHVGPMLSIPDATARIHVLQAFVATALVASLPFALILDESRKLERAITSSETQYRVLFEQVGEALLLYPIKHGTTPGTFARVNDKACRYLGYTRDELLRLTVRDIQAPENLVGVEQLIAEVVAGPPRSFERIHLAKNGRRIPVEVSSQAVDFAGEPHCLSIVRDVTERKQLEASLRQAERVESIGLLAGGIAHDFNNVLTAVIGYAQLIEERVQKGRPIALDDVSQIRRAGERASRLTRQLLAFSRPQMGEARDVDLGALLRETQPFFQRLVGASVTLVAKVAPEPLYVKADPGQLEQVVLNLVVNARDAMPGGGTVTLTLGGHEEGAREDVPGARYVELAVTDTGAGMSKEVLARIFEPFFTTKAVGNGTGIGLATVDRVVKRAGGRVDVDSEPGRGTTFRVRLPRRDAPPISPAAERRTASTAHRGSTVLLVEDDDAIRVLTRRALDGAGYEVIEARHPAEALALLGRPRPRLALLVTDIVMPGASGKDLLRELRSTQPDLPALLVSGFTTEDLDDLETGGARSRFLPKPFSQEALLDAADELLGEKDAATVLRGARVLVVDDDPMIRTVVQHLLQTAGVEVALAASGGEALAKLGAAEARPHAVILDYHLPDMDAPEVMRRIRAELHLAELPVVALTGHTSDDNLASCLACGMVARLSKPIDGRALNESLAKWIVRRGRTADA